MASGREQVVRLLADKRFADLSDLANARPGVVRGLFSCLYDRDPLLQWRAVLGFGELAAHAPGRVERTLSRLAYALNDEASICAWMSAPAVGEMTARNPDFTRRVVRVIVHYFTDPEACHGVNRNLQVLVSCLWVVGRIGSVHPALFHEVGAVVQGFMSDPVADVRGHALWAVVQASATRDWPVPGEMREDTAPTVVFDPVSAEFQSGSVGSFARRLLDG